MAVSSGVPVSAHTRERWRTLRRCPNGQQLQKALLPGVPMGHQVAMVADVRLELAGVVIGAMQDDRLPRQVLAPVTGDAPIAIGASHRAVSHPVPPARLHRHYRLKVIRIGSPCRYIRDAW